MLIRLGHLLDFLEGLSFLAIYLLTLTLYFSLGTSQQALLLLRSFFRIDLYCLVISHLVISKIG
jgi:hypothetical protein